MREFRELENFLFVSNFQNLDFPRKLGKLIGTKTSEKKLSLVDFSQKPSIWNKSDKIK